MPKTAHLQLPNGQTVDIQLQLSARNQYIRLSFSARNVLRVSGPSYCTHQQLLEFARQQGEQIVQWLQVAEARQLQDSTSELLPQQLELQAINKTIPVEYRAKAGDRLTLTLKDGGLLIEGSIDDPKSCQTLLQRWLLKMAHHHLPQQLAQVAEEIGLRYTKVAVRNQRGRWGSCNSYHYISLNAKLLFLPPELVHYVLVHELCHTVHPNHSPAFWELVSRFEPKLKQIRQQMKQTAQWIPSWV
ncbi:M48 family metallopeptidase [Thiofilum flexile]|uniref:M48 family metallopeptidase n=1 Tax=Thiofilum flexile TaxID=125627 RepID=UPI000379D8C8|nr:SprT family zinc-dependent metalloprotease [Thiofilum flexile]